jgi:hypothetical protein
MVGYARVSISEDSIYVRFENVHPRYLFDALRDRFSLAFPLKTWNDERGAWQLPPDDLDNAITFCRGIFGPKGCIVTRNSSTRSHVRQMTFDFNERASELNQQRIKKK